MTHIDHWRGKGAILVGLVGRVDTPSFDRLCEILHPRSGEPFTCNTCKNRRVGFDFTWSAAKSV
ncbi:MAG: relaxase domain-containing protein [Planctomycetaceae bacterium]|nr:relaxase domain-containing protein [Planctomycetaceae bacterium]